MCLQWMLGFTLVPFPAFSTLSDIRGLVISDQLSLTRLETKGVSTQQSSQRLSGNVMLVKSDDSDQDHQSNPDQLDNSSTEDSPSEDRSSEDSPPEDSPPEDSPARVEPWDGDLDGWSVGDEDLARLLLQAQGTLDSGDFVTFQDGSFYDEYPLNGEANQSIVITLESDDFDPYLILLNDSGSIIAQNDDVTAENINSAIVVTLPTQDKYLVIASSFKRKSRGQYRLTIWTTNGDIPGLNLPLGDFP